MSVKDDRAFLREAPGWGPEAVGAMTDDEVRWEAARVRRLERLGMTEDVYRKMYRKGWNRSEKIGSIPDTPNAENDAWMDGYLDSATGRERWHLLFCPDHDACP